MYIRYKGGNGLSKEEAVVIKGAWSSRMGVAAEYVWLGKHYRGFQLLGQGLEDESADGRVYDIIDFVMPDGEKKRIYFDITHFFGRHGWLMTLLLKRFESRW